MGGVTHLIVFLSMFSAITLMSEAQYLLAVTKDEPSRQYYTTVYIGSAAMTSPVNLLIDLGTNLTWLNCRKIKSLSTLGLVTCKSSTCKSIPGNGCDRNTCLYRQPRPLGKNTVVTTGRVVQDNATIFTTEGGQPVHIAPSRRFTFSCAVDKYLQGMAPPIAGVLALSPGEFPFWRQMTSAFNVIPKFSLCLPSSRYGYFFMGTPSLGGKKTVPMTSTTLKIDSGKYLISVRSIYVDGVPLTLDPSLLEGGAQLSTVVPFTVLQTDIYNALAQSFTLRQRYYMTKLFYLMISVFKYIKSTNLIFVWVLNLFSQNIGMTQTPGGHAPFKHCFGEGASGRNMDVSVMEIGLPGNGKEVKWRFQGANMMERVSETVICLAFVDGGKKPNESMVIGTHQLQDYLVEFDLSTTQMAFSDPLILHNTNCST
ncbi:probable aspartic proteinase GIP2 [Brassica napus]|nr:probable aspartic proteinase GIP2 [Brassica napus]